MATAELLAAMSALPSPPPSSEVDLDGKRGPARLDLAASTSSPPPGPSDALPMPVEGIEPLKRTTRTHSRNHSLLSPPSSTPPQVRQERRAAARRPPRRSVVFAGQLHQDGVNAVPKHRQMLFSRSPAGNPATTGCPPESPTGRRSRMTVSSSPLRRTSVASVPSDDDYAMSDASVLSDDDVLEHLVPNFGIHRRRARPSFDGPSMIPSSPSRSPAKKRVRSILKRTANAKVVVGDDLIKATMANGRYRAAPVGSRQVGPSATGKALMQILSDAPGDAADGPTPSLGGFGSLLPPAETSTRAGTAFQGGSTDGPSTSGDKGKGKAPSPPGGAGLTHPQQIDEQIDILSACLRTLVASLRPLPTEMRLDPMSPLAPLTTPLRLRLGPLGGLADSPHEPIDMLPRPPPSSFSEDLRRHLASAVPQTPNGPPSSPRPCSFQAVITLRDVEDAYSTMSFALESLSSVETGDARLRVSRLFEDASEDLIGCLSRDITNMVDDHATTMDREPRRQRSLSSSLEKAKAAKSQVVGAEAGKDKGGETTSEIRRRTAEVEAGQTAIKALAAVLSVQEWAATFPGTPWWWLPLRGAYRRDADADVSRLIELVIRIPDTPRLLKKKHMPVLTLHNMLFANQVLKPALLAPHSSDIVSTITTTLYLAW